jgi:cytochrome c oxidase cbb3-type subunit 3
MRMRVLVFLTVAGIAAPAGGQEGAAPTDHDLVRGRVHFLANCARCHGADGGGGEGPSLARARLPRAPDDASLVGIMSEGIPGTAMSSTWWLSSEELSQVAAYVRSLAPKGETGTGLAGDPVRGRALYDREGCDRCHTIGGFGTGRGPDLTSVGLRRGVGYLREAIVDPAAALPRGQTAIASDFVDWLMVRVVDEVGQELRGMRMNEDTYTIQIKDARGHLRSFYKPALRELEKEFDRSLMRSYRDRLTDEELDDLLSYLMTLAGERRAVS